MSICKKIPIYISDYAVSARKALILLQKKIAVPNRTAILSVVAKNDRVVFSHKTWSYSKILSNPERLFTMKSGLQRNSDGSW